MRFLVLLLSAVAALPLAAASTTTLRTSSSSSLESMQNAYLENVMDEAHWDSYELVKATDMTADDFYRLLTDSADNAAGDSGYSGSLSATGCYKSRANGGWGYCGPPSCVSFWP